MLCPAYMWSGIAGVRVSAQLTPDVHKDADGDYTFNLLDAMGLNGSTSTNSIMLATKATPPHPSQPVSRNHTATYAFGTSYANQSEAVAACSRKHAMLAVPHGIDDLWQLNRGVAEALAMEGDYFHNLNGWVLLGGHKAAPNLCLTPAVPSTGSAPPILGMDLYALGDGTVLEAFKPGPLSGDCLRLINWSNLQYSAWLYRGQCDEGTYLCVRTG
jgi:hypothetical protein